MVISFFGHSDFIAENNSKEIVLSTLNSLVKGKSADIYLGGYGSFDRFAHACCKELKKNCNGSVKLYYITAYLGNNLEKSKEYLTKEYDGIVYPPIENTPKKVAIVVRNEWIVQQSDVIIAYVGRTFGGAYKAVAYAEKKGKKVINLYGIM